MSNLATGLTTELVPKSSLLSRLAMLRSYLAGVLRAQRMPVGFYLLSMAATFIGVSWAIVCPMYMHGQSPQTFFRVLGFGWDAGWYTAIAVQGYSFDTSGYSSIAFFPAYPLLGAALSKVFGIAPPPLMLLVSHACFLGVFLLMFQYLRQRLTPKQMQSRLPALVLAVVALWPFNLYYVMNFTEPLFLLTALAAVYGMQRGSSLTAIAVIVGMATATRLTGLALLPPLALCIWLRDPRWSSFLARSAYLMPLACWGLLAFVLYNAVAFDNPLAFYEAQKVWMGKGQFPISEKLVALATLKPVWLSIVHWRAHLPYPGCSPLFSPSMANTVFFSLACVLVVIGAWKRWLTHYELLLAAGLLFIPYFSKSMEIGLDGFGRYASVAFPIYLVAGRLLAAITPALAALVLTISASFLILYAMLFANGYAFC